jgi:tRNA pseudouridine38/39 synthase
MQIPLGAGTVVRKWSHTPLLRRKRLDSVEDANERWRTGKGERRMARRAAAAVDDDDDDE